MAIGKRKLRCIVPHCRCHVTIVVPATQVICAKHYRLVDTKLKRLRTRMRKKFRKKADEYRLAVADSLIWRKMVRQAIERAAGIG